MERIEMFLRHKFKETIMIYMQYAIAKWQQNASMGTVGHADNLSKVRKKKLIIIIYTNINIYKYVYIYTYYIYICAVR